VEAIEKALDQANADEERPTLIEVRTTIGYGAPHVAGTNKVHGNPLGSEETEATKKNYGWEHEPFYVPDEIRDHFNALNVSEAAAETAWKKQFEAYSEAYPELAAELRATIGGELAANYADQLPQYEAETQKATRQTSGEVINALAKTVPALFGGAADLASSTKTAIKGGGEFLPESYNGRNIWFGVREFAMSAAVNGMALHGGVIPYGSTFFTFSDYAKPAIRLAALMGIPSIFVFTHDSIAVGEDGPTHEPIEQLAGLRAIPNVNVLRPADGNEVREAWKVAVESRNRPTVLVLTRQNVDTVEGEVDSAAEGVQRGGYIVSEAKGGKPEGILLATGSEVCLAVKAQQLLEAEQIHVRVVSLPSWELFRKQSDFYKETVLPAHLTARVGIEMASSQGWHEFVGLEGELVTIDRFGSSAPAGIVTTEYGFTPENVASVLKKADAKRQTIHQ
jgi:transketolase